MVQPLRVLLVGYGSTSAVSHELAKAGHDLRVQTVLNRAALEDALATAHDIAISDFKAGEISALEVLRVIQERGVDLPVIVVSGRLKGYFRVLAGDKDGKGAA